LPGVDGPWAVAFPDTLSGRGAAGAVALHERLNLSNQLFSAARGRILLIFRELRHALVCCAP